jgi:hypothetical protein
LFRVKICILVTVFSDYLWTLEGQMLEQKIDASLTSVDPLIHCLCDIAFSHLHALHCSFGKTNWFHLGDKLTRSSDFHCCYHGNGSRSSLGLCIGLDDLVCKLDNMAVGISATLSWHQNMLKFLRS